MKVEKLVHYGWRIKPALRNLEVPHDRELNFHDNTRVVR